MFKIIIGLCLLFIGSIAAINYPEAYYSMQSLASIIGMETYETLLVNSIVDFSSWCTSIVAQMTNGTIVHARNLDFDYP